MNEHKKKIQTILVKTTKRKSCVQGLDLDHIISRGNCVEIRVSRTCKMCKQICRNLNTDGENKYTNKRFKLWEIEYFLSDYVFFSFLCVFNTYNASNKPLCRNLNTDGENKYTNKRFKLWEIEYFLSDYVFFSFLCVFNTFNASNKPLIF